MEHRCSKRNPIQQSVVVNCPRVGLASANICDIGLGGMFVETDGLDFPLGAPVFVAFGLAPSKDHDDFGLEAMVVRHTPTGVGLMFLDMETSIARALHSALYGAPIFEAA